MPLRCWPARPASRAAWRKSSLWRAPMLAMWVSSPRWSGHSNPSNRSSDLSMSLFTMQARGFGAPPRRWPSKISRQRGGPTHLEPSPPRAASSRDEKARRRGTLSSSVRPSRRGGAKTAAFASAKAAQRSLAESLARSLGSSGIHVSLIIIDGIVDEPSVRTKLADKLDSFFVKPDDVADTAAMLTRQKPSAWTFELEARPFGETW